MGNKLVTAIITTHNRKDLLLGAIASVQRQTYAPMELIVVDDASSDGTKELLEVLSKQQGFRFIDIPKEESRGGNHARNLGIMEAHGELVAFLDDDDEWLPEKIQKQTAYMRDNPQCGVVACGRIIENRFGKSVKQDISDRPEGELSETVFKGPVMVTSEMLVQKQLLIEAGLFDENLKYWQEYELSIRLFQRTQMGLVKEYLVLYRAAGNDKNRLTNNIDGWEEAIRYIHEKHKELFQALPPEVEKQHRLCCYYEAATRAGKTGNRTLKKACLKRIYETEPTIKNWVKYMLNVNDVRNNFVQLTEICKKLNILGGGVYLTDKSFCSGTYFRSEVCA